MITLKFYDRGSVRNLEEISKDGLIPASVAQVMMIRLGALGKDCAFRANSKMIVTSDGIMFSPEGKMKLDLDSERIRRFNRTGELIALGQIPITREDYEQNESEEFNSDCPHIYFLGDRLNGENIFRKLCRNPDIMYDYLDLKGVCFKSLSGLRAYFSNVGDGYTLAPISFGQSFWQKDFYSIPGLSWAEVGGDMIGVSRNSLNPQDYKRGDFKRFLNVKRILSMDDLPVEI